jgi:hypothetical protein
MRCSCLRAVGLAVLTTALVWPIPASAQRHGGGGGGRGGPGPRAVAVAPVHVAGAWGHGWWGPGWWGPSMYWGSPYWWGAWGPSPWGLWPYIDPLYMRTAAMSSVRVQVQPVQTEVFVDGYFAGVVDSFDGTFQRLRLDPGQHVIELYLPGHQPVRQDLLLAPGEGYKVRHTMQPLPPGAPDAPRPQPTTPPPGPVYTAPLPAGPPMAAGPPAPPPAPGARAEGFGQLVVRAQPGDAEILIDGEAWRGTADALTVNLTLGPHRVEVRKAGFTTFSTTVEVTAGTPATLNVSLLRDDPSGPEARR